MSIDLSQYQLQLAQLVAQPSVSCTDTRFDMGNRAVVDTLANWFEQLGFNCQLQEVADGKANLIAKKGTGLGGLVLAGHTDTVPFDANLWASDPFKLDNRSDCLFGLGSTDMKGFFPLVLAACASFEADPKRPITVLATCDEESSMNGARALSELGNWGAQAAIIGEPTGLTPVYMHKGIMMEAVEIQGSAGHSSNPALGVNAIDVLAEVLAELATLRSELALKYNVAGFEVSHPTMNFGCVHGGDNPNRICDHAALHIDFRATPGLVSTEIRELINLRLQQVASRTAARINIRPLITPVEPFKEDKTGELVTLASGLSEQEAIAVSFATEAPFLQALGMQTIVMGPGSIDVAHQPDEHIPLAQVDKGFHLLRSFINHYCFV